MKITKSIPAHDNVTTIQHFAFYPGVKECEVTVTDTDGKKFQVDVDFSDIWDAATTTHKNTIKGFFKAIAAKAKQVTPDDVEGDIV